MKKLLIPLLTFTIFMVACNKGEQPVPCTGNPCSDPNKEDMLSSHKPAPNEKSAPAGNATILSGTANIHNGAWNAARRLGDTPAHPMEEPTKKTSA